ncbi:MAG: hypothetical protein H6Q72_4430, partial [Firmicutes bacterium]|nr:hypothetical protein [Bacillota bacterium]
MKSENTGIQSGAGGLTFDEASVLA